MKNEPKYVEETLRWCNARRKEQDKEPLDKLPKGFRLQGASCPCGEATNLHVGKDFYWKRYSNTLGASEIGGESPLPRSVQRFIKAFDSGKLPQYDAEENR